MYTLRPLFHIVMGTTRTHSGDIVLFSTEAIDLLLLCSVGAHKASVRNANSSITVRLAWPILPAFETNEMSLKCPRQWRDHLP